MTKTPSLDDQSETMLAMQLASGRYADASDVVRDGLRLLESRERRASAFDSAVELGLADADAGRVHDADAVFDELKAELAGLSTPARA